jgi:glycosyltransferase involved in cell wall biosynthesis
MSYNAIFLTHYGSLRSEITGGVQLCSQEFHQVLVDIQEIELQDYYVPYTKNIFQRAMAKLGLENYYAFDIEKESPALLSYIEANHIEIVFINMATAVRFAKPVKKRFGNTVKVILLSHGNHSGDFLHLITKPIDKQPFYRRIMNRIRLGMLLATEAEYRVKWLDAVVTISETEKQIENWFGARRVAFLPRKLYKDFLHHEPVIGRIGFVGRLDHPPNLQGVTILLEELSRNNRDLEFRLVGAPPKYGDQIRNDFPFVNYLGELSDKDLEKEVATWSFFLNPVWWYSTGASTKLARAISWGLPIITTTAGMRGYQWEQGSLLVADSPGEMSSILHLEARSPERIKYWREQTRLIAENGQSPKELAERIRYAFE